MGLEYTDASQQFDQVAQRVEAEAGPPEQWTEPALPPLPDITTDAVKAALLQLQQLLHVETGGGGSGGGSSGGGGGGAGPSSAAAAAAGPAEATPQGLQRAKAMLETCILPALAELAKQQRQGQAAPGGAEAGAPPAAAASGASQRSAAAAMLAQYPLGFSTGDAAADLGATILRMLYIKDLRALQVQREAVGGRGWGVELGRRAGGGWWCGYEPGWYCRSQPHIPLARCVPPLPPADAGGLCHSPGAGVYSQPAY